jgi:hypothetical protein
MVDFNNFEPYTDSLANEKDQRIFIQHVPTNYTVVFKAFLTQFEDALDSQWEDDTVYGRMDPISTFKRTGRIISLAWDVPAASFEEAQRNMKEASQLLQTVYPTYSQIGNNNIISASPLLRIKFMNLIQNVSAQQATVNDPVARQFSGIVNGLLGKVNGFRFAPDLEQGSFDPPPQQQVLDENNRAITNPNYFEIYPKLLKFSLYFYRSSRTCSWV